MATLKTKSTPKKSTPNPTSKKPVAKAAAKSLRDEAANLKKAAVVVPAVNAERLNTEATRLETWAGKIDGKSAAACDKPETEPPVIAPAEPPKPEPKAPKAARLRKKSDIINALKAGGKLTRRDGIYKLETAAGVVHACSKRRCVALIANGDVTASGTDTWKYAEPKTPDIAASRAAENAPTPAAEPEVQE